MTDLVRFADQPSAMFVVYAPLFDEDFHRTGTLVARLQTTELASIVRATPVDDATALFVLHRGTTLADHCGGGAPSAPGARGTFEATAPVAADGLGLSVVAASDARAVLAPLAALALRSAVVGAIVLALAWLATALTARRIARPLRAVADAATRLASGDLDARVARTGGVRETVELADAFNAMSETLRERRHARDRARRRGTGARRARRARPRGRPDRRRRSRTRSALSAGVRAGKVPVALMVEIGPVNATFQVLIEPEDGGFVTFVPVLDFASTQGSTREQALERTRELILGYLEAAEKEGIAIDVPPRGGRAEMVDLAISA